MGKVKMQGGRPENIRDGDYVFTVDAAKAFVSRAGHDSVVFEFLVEGAETTKEDVRPNRVGSKVRAFFPLYRDRDNELTQDGERWMSRLKTLLAQVLGGEERVDAEGNESPVMDEEVTPRIAASIIKGTEYAVASMGPEKKAHVMFEVATKKTKDGGLGIPPDAANDAIESGQLNFADIRGLKLRCRAKTVMSSKGKPFTNTYWAPFSE